MQPVPCAGKRVTGAKRAKTCNWCRVREKNMKPVPCAGKRLKTQVTITMLVRFCSWLWSKAETAWPQPVARPFWPLSTRKIKPNDCQSKPAVSSCTAGLHEHNSVWRFPLPIYRDNQWRKWGGEWFFVVLLIQFLHVCDRVAWITPHLATRDADTTRQSVGDLVRWVSRFSNKPCSSFRIFLSSVYTQTGYFCMRFSSEHVTKVSSTIVSLKRSWIQHFVCEGLLKKLFYSSSYFWVSLKRSWFVNQNVTGICGVWDRFEWGQSEA